MKSDTSNGAITDALVEEHEKLKTKYKELQSQVKSMISIALKKQKQTYERTLSDL